ncbi:hypothetical protein PIB30_029266 [Stylosanthes scabra]|uniref:Uncharacterized protein n=1 Tax=Stylosanthes scabra TaxID=79078 RepID=A0ABU6UA21_9FABA|nr:hypothetical protein [Stylosanthes scabra]
MDEKKPIIKVEPVLDEQINTPKVIEDADIDIVSWTNKGDLASNKNEDPDATEYSSSFGDTTSGTENGSRVSDAEVESEFLGDSGLACNFDAFDSAFHMRKKKLTDHWRNFIRPLMWRCKWAELRIREIESQALKYSKELAEYDKRKHMEPDHFTLEEFGSKSLPFTSHEYRCKAKKRRKRKKVEDTTDLATYTSNHNLFSYLENKKSDLEGCSAEDFSNPVITELHADSTDRFGIGDQSFFEYSESDSCMEQLLWTIDNLHSRVQKLKGQVDMVMSKNTSKLSSSENLSLLPHGDVQTSSAPSPTTSAANGDAISVGAIYNSARHIPEFDLGDLVLPDSAVSSYGEVTIIPDIIESTVGLLAAADVTLHPPLVGDSCDDMVDSVLIREVAETEDHVFKSVSHHPIKKLQISAMKCEGEEKTLQHVDSVPASDLNNVAVNSSAGSQEQPVLKQCLHGDASVPKNKRKRGERKAGSVGWSKKCSAEPDSQ